MLNDVVFVSGRFNILHSGHLRLLKFAKSLANKLVVGVVLGDDRNPDLTPISARLEALASCEFIDETVCLSEDVCEALTRVKPRLVVKGREFATMVNPEQAWCERVGAQLVFSSGEWHDFIPDGTMGEFNDSKVLQLDSIRKFLERAKISVNEVNDAIHGMTSLKSLVVGDVIVDEYIDCDPLGMSQEEPSLVLRPTEETFYLGGAAIVANHLQAFGDQSSLFSVIGNDSRGIWVEDCLKQLGVGTRLVKALDRPTTLKTRYRVRGGVSQYSLFRVSRLSEQTIPLDVQKEILKQVTAKCEDVDILVFSDFNYGLLPKSLVQNIIKVARQHNVMISADSQTSSQLGDVLKFTDVDLIFATEHEARTSLRNQDDGLITIAENLASETQCLGVFLKLGSNGAILHRRISPGNSSPSFSTERLAALNMKPLDVAGAGDSMMAVASLAMAASGNMLVAFLLGSMASAAQVGKIGNPGISAEEILTMVDLL